MPGVTLPPRWLRVSCSAGGQVTARWKRALGLDDVASVEFTATIVALQADGTDGDELDSHTGTERTLTAPGAPGTKYKATVQTEPVAGYPVYTEARTKQCKPAPATG